MSGHPFASPTNPVAGPYYGTHTGPPPVVEQPPIVGPVYHPIAQPTIPPYGQYQPAMYYPQQQMYYPQQQYYSPHDGHYQQHQQNKLQKCNCCESLMNYLMCCCGALMCYMCLCNICEAVGTDGACMEGNGVENFISDD